jgi:hypothetical protein
MADDVEYVHDNKIRWIDMIDPVYTLALLAGVDPELNTITSISIQDDRLIVRYTDKSGKHDFSSVAYDLEA